MPRSRWDFKRPFCEVCGKTGGWYTQEGWRTCEEHWGPKPDSPVPAAVEGERIVNSMEGEVAQDDD